MAAPPDRRGPRRGGHARPRALGHDPRGPLQGVVFLGLLVPWARYVDRRPLSVYGVSASWLASLLVGFAAVVGVWGVWHGLASSLGWMTIERSTGAPLGALVSGLGGRLVSLAIDTWIQDIAFFAIDLASAAEGLHSRDVDPPPAP